MTTAVKKLIADNKGNDLAEVCELLLEFAVQVYCDSSLGDYDMAHIYLQKAEKIAGGGDE